MAQWRAMSWTADEIEAEWLAPAGEALVRPADQVVDAVNLAERIRGSQWVRETTHLPSGGRALGYLMSLSKVISFGTRVSTVLDNPGRDELLARLRAEEAAADSELTAIFLLRAPNRESAVEIGPAVTVDNRNRRPDFRIRCGDSPWTYVEVTQLRASRPSTRTQLMLQRIAERIFVLERTVILEIILDREPLDGEDHAIVERAHELALAEPSCELRVDGVARILLKNGATNVASPTQTPEDDRPRMAIMCAASGPNAINRQVIVRVPFADMRAEES
jgi:hypothetical protein